MKALASLLIGFNSSCNPDYVSTVYNHCKQLHTFTIRLKIKNDDFQFVEKMIESMKSDLVQRASPLNLILRNQLSI